jgi:Tol biopolymer transport system component
VPDAGRGDATEALTLTLPPGARRIVGFDWAPDGRKLAVAIVLGVDPEAAPTLWLVPADGGPAEAVPGDGRRAASFPEWSPDGSRIAFITPDRCDAATDCPSIVRILDAASGVRRAEVENLWAPATVRWSPDGTMLAVDAVMPNDSARPQRREVFVYTLADNTVRRISDTPEGRTWLLGWAPDRSSLLVSREVGATGAREAWRLDAASGGGGRLADDAHGVALQPQP